MIDALYVCEYIESVVSSKDFPEPPVSTIKKLPIYIGGLPEENNECVSISLYDGVAGTEYFGTRDSFDTLLIRIVVRSMSYPNGQYNTKYIKDVLDKYVELDKATEIYGTTLIGSPRYLGRDTLHRHEFLLNIKVIMLGVN